MKEELTKSGAVLWGHVLGEIGGPLLIGKMLKVFSPEQIEKYVMPVGYQCRSGMYTAYLEVMGIRLYIYIMLSFHPEFFTDCKRSTDYKYFYCSDYYLPID
ncbi:hypothetical protein [Peribacillus simplex]|uniref:hypothetical protein n=1 Tax=Peribacillus simplex TaxID=1478 RepID=UPI00366ADF5A